MALVLIAFVFPLQLLASIFGRGDFAEQVRKLGREAGSASGSDV